jgi:hypothetical protein
MNENYKKLMIKHGGFIPFSALIETKTNSKTNSKMRNKKTFKIKRRKNTIYNKSLYNAGKYTPGTIIRNNGILYHLNNNRQWTKI